jgi:Protein of unknown function (DUF1236)
MQRSNLLAGTAIALIMCAVPALAQQKSEEKSSPAQTQSESKEQGKQQKGTSENKAAPKEKSAQGGAQSEGKEKGAQTREKGHKGTAQGSGKDHDQKGSAQTESREKGSKGTAQGPSKDKDKDSAQAPSKDKGTAQTPSKDKGAAQAPGKEQDKMGSGQAEKDRAGKDNAQKQPKDGGAQKSTERQGSGERVQLSEQQRTNVHQTLLKESNLNRATNVNISVSVGTRIPRSVRLVALPASIISVVPAYRSYQYVVVNDEICIVDPNSYEIVEVIAAPGGRTARTDSHQGSTTLVLTEEEKAIVLRSVDTDRSSTLGLGTLTEGSSVPRGANVQAFPDTVVQQVPKLKDHKFFAAENRVAIVDGQGDKVQLVLEGKR